jgi:hypothetical protein
MEHLSFEETIRRAWPLRRLSDAALAAEWQRVKLLTELTSEEAAYIDALGYEVQRRSSARVCNLADPTCNV